MADVTTEIASNNSNQATELDALVIGAGFAGLYQLLCLRDRLGLSVKALEAGGGVGGTWYWNRYPGARCDSESHVYWYTFSPDLMREWEWSERYPGQPEIMRYLNHVADRFDLKRDIQFNTRVTAAHYDETANRWRVRTETGETFVAKFLITAVGCLSTANVPKFEGLESFAGDWYHTGQWPHEGVDFTGKRVGMIGTGSTGIQAAPVIAAAAKHLTVFQRTANYSVPARNAPLTPEFQRYIKENPAEIRAVTRETLNGMAFRIEERLAVETPPEEREAIYEAAWERGGLQFRAAFKDMMVDKAANDTAADFVKRKIRSIVKDPKTAAILSDIDHPYAAKRPPIDTDYFETFNRPNVTLVDVKATPIERISPAGVCTTRGGVSAGHHRLRDRLRCHDRPDAADGYSRARRRRVEGCVGSGSAQLPRSADRGLSQSVHDHRPGQPVRAVQHAGGDRAARGLDRRLHRAHARERPGTD